MLLTLRIILVTFTACALLFAVNSKSTMYEMVQNAYNVTLAGAFIPLLAGAYWRRASTQGALFSIVLGIGTWLTANTVAPEALVPPNLVGFFASIIGMLLGSLAPQLIANRGHSIVQATHAQGAHAHRRHGPT
jgi:Na+/proline symporter